MSRNSKKAKSGAVRRALRPDLDLSQREFDTLKRLRTPHKIQEYLNGIKANFEPHGDTVLSVREVLKQRRAHCIEGALLAACALWIQGEPPLLLDLKAVHDYDHVVALFRRGGCWGAISKTNHPQLRHRDAVYRSLRELAISYFHEYTNKKGRQTLRQYSRAFDLRKVDPKLWVTNGDDCWEVADILDEIHHYPLITAKQTRLLHRRDAIERKAGKLLQYPAPRRK
ncbi:MAG TPA: hypothetical protein VLL03_05195 [Burkholderiales bacterium]|nr:hypothetical protein [Burkholderiales bacterium]